jgi:hypothetical protein
MANPKECREFQMNGLLNWKNYDDCHDQADQGEFLYHEVNDIFSEDLNNYAEDLEAILINPPWKEISKFNFENFTKIKLPLNKMKEGLIFIWAEKEYISDLVYFFENKNIKYVENLIWVTLDSSKQCKCKILLS